MIIHESKLVRSGPSSACTWVYEAFETTYRLRATCSWPGTDGYACAVL